MSHRPPYSRSDKFAVAIFWLTIGVLLIIGAVALISSASGQVPQQRGPLGGPPSAEEIELGRALFFDPLLSQDGTVSCATCHDPRLGWSDGLPVAVGIRSQAGTRNTPTALGSSYMPAVFWDGRTTGFETQALLPLENPIEMGQQSTADVVRRLRAQPGYVRRFIDVFGDANSIVDDVKISRAISAFESTLVSFDAPIDRFTAGDRNALTHDARIGLDLFRKANCTACHKAPLYTDNLFWNDGTEFATRGRLVNGGSGVATSDQGRFDVAPAGQRTNAMRRAFKTPTLREIARTAPYGHNGQFPDLARVVRHKNVGGNVVIGGRTMRDPSIDPRIKQQGWTNEQEGYVVRFLTEAFAGADYPLVEAPALPR